MHDKWRSSYQLQILRSNKVVGRRNSQKKYPDNNLNTACQLNKCKVNVEDIKHVISSCQNMSARYYLALSHDTIAEAIFTALRKEEYPKEEYRKEYWWKVAVKHQQK